MLPRPPLTCGQLVLFESMLSRGMGWQIKETVCHVLQTQADNMPHRHISAVPLSLHH